MFTIVKVTTEGEVTRIDLPERPNGPYGHGSLLDFFYEQIGCDTVECRDLNEQVTAWFDEEALMNADPEVNPVATALCGFFNVRNRATFTGPDIGFFGNCVFTGTPDEEGDTQGLPEQWAAFLVAAVHLANDTINNIPGREQEAAPAEQ